MQDIIAQHKAAWEFDAYAFWVKHNGTPEQLAQKIRQNPRKSLKKYSEYFTDCTGLRIANICGSCGKNCVGKIF